MIEAPWFIACEGTATASLAVVLGAELKRLPGDVLALEAWRAEALVGAPRRQVVAAPWQAEVAPRTVCAASAEDWLERAEDPIARWVFALGVAAARCADGGAIVAVVERPAPLDCAGFAAETAVADAACALVRSLARSEGARGVRVNAVVTSTRLAPRKPIAPAPPLPSFPGTLEVEVAGAVRLLLASDASGITGQVLAADCGRSW